MRVLSKKSRPLFVVWIKGNADQTCDEVCGADLAKSNSNFPGETADAFSLSTAGSVTCGASTSALTDAYQCQYEAVNKFKKKSTINPIDTKTRYKDTTPRKKTAISGLLSAPEVSPTPTCKTENEKGSLRWMCLVPC